jgi:CRISPR/Cas system-associated exonuclease Cas4 (RecB family)
MRHDAWSEMKIEAPEVYELALTGYAMAVRCAKGTPRFWACDQQTAQAVR